MMEDPDAPPADPFARIRLLLGSDVVERLHEAHVVVVGLGAVGSYAVEALARAGVGRLRLVDFDIVHPSNINRQLTALHSTLGQRKADLAAARVRDISSRCQVEALPVFLHHETLPQVLQGLPDLVLDCIDSLNPKVELIAGCIYAGVPCISSMGAALRRDPSRVRFGDITEVRHDPLARVVRKRLRRRGVSSGVPCVFSDEPPSEAVASPAEADVPTIDRGRRRNALGSLPTLTGIVGLTLAHHALNALTLDALKR